MLQQIIALVIIAFFLFRSFEQKRSKKIGIGEFYFWFLFWILAGLAVVFIKKIDILVAELGFSGSGIEVLLYLAVVILFYLNFRLRLRIFKMDREITKIVRHIAIDKKTQNSKLKIQN